MTLVMQLAHANSAGFIHGGEIMKLVDTAAGGASMRHSNGRVVTVELDTLTFLAPVHIGDRRSHSSLAFFDGGRGLRVA